jgi:hypothetical protein
MYGFTGEPTHAPRNWRREKRRASKIFARCIASRKLILSKRYVHYAMQRVRLLRHYGIHPYLVFDGGRLPAKRGTEEERRRRRTENLARANAFAAEGKHTQAREYFSKCIDVTPEMAFQLIKVRRARSYHLNAALTSFCRRYAPRASPTLWLLTRPMHSSHTSNARHCRRNHHRRLGPPRFWLQECIFQVE